MIPAFRSGFVVLSVALASERAHAQAFTVRISVDSNGAQCNYGGQSPTISADSRFIAFASGATNLVPNDTNSFYDVFVRDLYSGTVELVSVSAGGVQGNKHSSLPSLSADGRYVAFSSGASNLVASDSNGFRDTFVCDRTTGAIELVSVNSAGGQANGASFDLSISADGRFVAFDSDATNLVPGDTNGIRDAFVRDRATGVTERVSVATGGAQGLGWTSLWTATQVAISADGRYVVFETNESTLVPNDTNQAEDIFLRDRALGTTIRVSEGAGGAPPNSYSIDPGLSRDGRFVVFVSMASNLVPNDTNGALDVFVRDLQAGTVERVSVDSFGIEGDNTSSSPPTRAGPISGDGRYVAFNSPATNLVANDTNLGSDIFVRDRVSGTTSRANVSTSGAQANSFNYGCAISADGRIVAFESLANNLVAGDTNGYSDVFARIDSAAPSVYCTPGTSSSGCSASIGASANPSLSLAHACQISVTGVEGLKWGIVFYGTDNSGFSPVSWAPGNTSWRCVRYPAQRTSLQNSGGTIGACDGSYSLDWNAFQSSHPQALGNPWSVGRVVYLQAWFRDPAAVKSTNLSDALVLMYGP